MAATLGGREVLSISAVSRSPTQSRIVAWLALVLASLAFALGAASSAAAAVPPGVDVLDHDSNVLVAFHSAKCFVANARAKAPFSFQATAKSRGWSLNVFFWKDESPAFSGFHMYRLHFGVQSAISVSVFAPDRKFYSLEYAPPNPPASAGGMKLGPKGALMSVGAFAVFAPDLQTAVAIAGGLQCNYPRRRRGH
jgi:hypothetical protein